MKKTKLALLLGLCFVTHSISGNSVQAQFTPAPATPIGVYQCTNTNGDDGQVLILPHVSVDGELQVSLGYNYYYCLVRWNPGTKQYEWMIAKFGTMKPGAPGATNVFLTAPANGGAGIMEWDGNSFSHDLEVQIPGGSDEYDLTPDSSGLKGWKCPIPALYDGIKLPI